MRDRFRFLMPRINDMVSDGLVVRLSPLTDLGHFLCRRLAGQTWSIAFLCRKSSGKDPWRCL